MSLDQPQTIKSFTRLHQAVPESNISLCAKKGRKCSFVLPLSVHRVSIACIIALILLITLLATTRLFAQTATLPPGANSFDIVLQSTLTDVDHFQLAPPYLYTVQGSTFNAYDISNPAAPTTINTMSLLSATAHFEYSGTLAYLLQEQSTPTAAISNSELWILDLATPAGVITKTAYTVTQWNNNPDADPGYPLRDAIIDFIPFDDHLLMAHSRPGDSWFFNGSDKATLSLLDLSTPLTPTVVSTTTVELSVRAMEADGKNVYVYSTVFGRGLTGHVHRVNIFDYENLLQPTLLDKYQLNNYGYTSHDFFTHENSTYMYTVEYPQLAERISCDVPGWTSPALRVRNTTDPANPVDQGFYYEPGYPATGTCDQQRRFTTMDGYNQTIAAAISDKLYLIDRSNPTALFTFGDITISDTINELQINDGIIVAQTLANQLQIFSYAQQQAQSRYIDQTTEHQFYLNEMGFYIPQNGFTQPISFTVQTYNIDQTAPVTQSLYATHPLYQIAAVDPENGEQITPSEPFLLEANYDSLNFGKPLDAQILGNTLSFYRWEEGSWQKVPSTIVNAETPYPTVSAQVDRAGVYTVLAQKVQLSYMPLIQR